MPQPSYWRGVASKSFLSNPFIPIRLVIHSRVSRAIVLVLLLWLCVYVYQSKKSSLSSGQSLEYIVLDDEDNENKYVVDMPTCKIPFFQAWGKTHIFHPDGPHQDCRNGKRFWAYVQGTEIILNKTAVIESGYSFNSIRCCYQIIERVEQDLEKYDMDADNKVRISKECHPIKLPRDELRKEVEFLRMRCMSTSMPWFDYVVYRDYLFVPHKNGPKIERKLEKWKEAKEQKIERPPNVVILGIDSCSRLNIHRNAKKTVKFLKEIGAVEMLGYSKTGSGTFANSVTILSGNYDNELAPCFNWSQPMDAQDDCPYLWKGFDKAGYLTIEAEDYPYYGSFSYLTAGFVHKPTDYYLRPLIQSWVKYEDYIGEYWTPCVGRYWTEEIILEYYLSVVNSYQNAPVFALLWTNVAHENDNNLRIYEDRLLSFLKVLERDKNTIFFVMGDHGRRFGAKRKSIQGWFEDILPVQWVYIPENLRARFPDWYSSLVINSKRLTSHFDTYKTLLHILETFDVKQEAREFYEETTKRGQSMFQVVPDTRTCQDAGIPPIYCPCSGPQKLDLKDEKVERASQTAIEYLQKALPADVCAIPELKNVSNAYVVETTSTFVTVVTIVTSPGDFVFEAYLEKDGNGTFYVSTDLLRMDKMTRWMGCVDKPILRKYCYCK